MIPLEFLTDGSPSARNFEKLSRLVPDTLGFSVKLRAISGGVTSAGTVSYGVGFTVTRTATGMYTLTYTNPFPVQPALQLGTDNGTPLRMYWTGTVGVAATGGADIHVTDTSGTATNAAWNFTALYLG